MFAQLRSLWRDSSNNVDKRLFGVAGVLLIAFAVSYVTPAAQNIGKAQSAFPASVCPAKMGDGTTTAFLPKYRTAVRHVAKKSLTFYKSVSAFENISSNALLVEGNAATSFALNNSGNGIGAVLCQSGNADQWFVGGSGGLTSKDQLDIVNSGLSPAQVDIIGYSSKQVLPVISLLVPANSDRLVLLDALVPGEDSVVLHVLTRAGRVTSFLFDQRKKGLSSLGADFVNSQDAPSKDLVIPAMMQSSNGKVASSIRILVPGNLDANLKLTINSGDGAFTPLGFDGRAIPHGRVIDIPLTNLTSTTPMSIHLESDQPLLAAALTSLQGADFAWSIPVSPLTQLSLNFTGLNPKFVFTGSSIDVAINWKNSSGKSMSAHVTGSDIAFWNPGAAGVRTISFTSKTRSPVYGGTILRNSSGSQLAYLPLRAGAVLEKSTLPIVDVRSLSH
jgi:Family of unknown function (DUF5719)